MNKPPEFWVAIVVGVLIVLHRNVAKSYLSRATLAAISGGLAYSFAGELSEWSGRSETLSAVLLSAFGYMVFDVLASILSDKEFLRKIIADRMKK